MTGHVVEMAPDEGLAGIDRLSQHYRGRPYTNRTSRARQRLDRGRALAGLGGQALEGLSCDVGCP